MKTTWMLSLLAAAVLFLGGGVLWIMMSSNPAIAETILIYSVDFLGVLWFLTVIALAIVSWSRSPAPNHDAHSTGSGSG